MTLTRGFIALTSVLVLSAVFLSVTITLATRAISGSQITTAYYDRDRAQYLADACIELALIELIETFGYEGGDTMVVGDGSCDVVSIGGSGVDDRTIHVESTVGAHTFRVVVDVASISPTVTITSYEHVVAF